MSTGIYESTNKQLIPTAGSAPQVTIDANPTQGSTNAVSSGGVYTGLGNKQDTLTFDNVPQKIGYAVSFGCEKYPEEAGKYCRRSVRPSRDHTYWWSYGSFPP